MMLIIQGCCFIQSLHFSYELQEDSVQKSKQSVQFPCIRPDDVVFRPDAHLSKHHPSGQRKLSVQTSLCVQKLRTVQDCIRPNVLANRLAAIQSSRRIQCSSTSVRTTWQYRQDAIQCSTSYRVSVSDIDMGRQLQPSGRCMFPFGRCMFSSGSDPK
jgi:hypothetical protein